MGLHPIRGSKLGQGTVGLGRKSHRAFANDLLDGVSEFLKGRRKYVVIGSFLVAILVLVTYYAIVEIPPAPIFFVRDPTNPLVLDHTEPEVIKVGSAFYLYYRTDHSIGIASSMDGLNWSDVSMALNRSTTGWDDGEVIAPSVLSDSGTFYLYYEASDSATGN